MNTIHREKETTSGNDDQPCDNLEGLHHAAALRSYPALVAGIKNRSKTTRRCENGPGSALYILLEIPKVDVSTFDSLALFLTASANYDERSIFLGLCPLIGEP